jgi:16S rRNA G966 N2-methylase RsmD
MTITQTTSRRIPQEVQVRRSDPVYNAHAYLTKVPVTAIEPFIEAFTRAGDLVLDPFAGSGMTGVAAAMLGRRAALTDISVLGAHIGRNYLNLVDPTAFRAAAREAVEATRTRLGDVYGVTCSNCRQRAELSRRTWSFRIRCRSCADAVNYYRAFEASDWGRRPLRCSACSAELGLKNAERVGEEVVLDTLSCTCSRRMRDQEPTEMASLKSDGATAPEVEIATSRQMFQASALGKHGLTTVASFYSPRNLVALATLREEIGKVGDEALREKLLFAFTAVLTRASKRYQWSRKRPLNAANQNYYIALVFYEWNVFDLFLRKVEALVKSDAYIADAMGGPLLSDAPAVSYRVGSAASLDLADGSVDYVFTDPPFGSNIFYSDMNLFQEAWLGNFTDETQEAVVDRSRGASARTAERYEGLLTDALREAHRVLKDDGWLSLVFSNSSGQIWALLQRAIRAAEFVVDPEGISLLDKGQRSVKGLASGFEDVVTVDLVLSMRKKVAGDEATAPTARDLDAALDAVLERGPYPSPSHVYLNVVREGLRHHWDLTPISYAAVSAALAARGYEVDASSGRLGPGAAPPEDQKPGAAGNRARAELPA